MTTPTVPAAVIDEQAKNRPALTKLIERYRQVNCHLASDAYEDKDEDAIVAAALAEAALLTPPADQLANVTVNGRKPALRQVEVESNSPIAGKWFVWCNDDDMWILMLTTSGEWSRKRGAMYFYGETREAAIKFILSHADKPASVGADHKPAEIGEVWTSPLAATRTPQACSSVVETVTCPACEGSGKSGMVPSPFIRTTNGKPLSEEQATALFEMVAKCRFCEGAGKVPPEQLEWRATGQRWREKRRAIKVGMREWAERAGALPSDYCQMENGTMKPDPKFEPVAVQPPAPASDEFAADTTQPISKTVEALRRDRQQLKSQIDGVIGALADAGDVLADRLDGDYGASVRQVVEQRDALRQQLADVTRERDEAGERQHTPWRNHEYGRRGSCGCESCTLAKLATLTAELAKQKQVVIQGGPGVVLPAGSWIPYKIGSAEPYECQTVLTQQSQHTLNKADEIYFYVQVPSRIPSPAEASEQGEAGKRADEEPHPHWLCEYIFRSRNIGLVIANEVSVIASHACGGITERAIPLKERENE